jgi:hypothetical protein
MSVRNAGMHCLTSQRPVMRTPSAPWRQMALPLDSKAWQDSEIQHCTSMCVQCTDKHAAPKSIAYAHLPGNSVSRLASIVCVARAHQINTDDDQPYCYGSGT